MVLDSTNTRENVTNDFEIDHQFSLSDKYCAVGKRFNLYNSAISEMILPASNQEKSEQVDIKVQFYYLKKTN